MATLYDYLPKRSSPSEEMIVISLLSLPTVTSRSLPLDEVKLFLTFVFAVTSRSVCYCRVSPFGPEPLVLPSARRGEGPLPWFVLKDSGGVRLFYAVIALAITTSRYE